MLRRSRKRVAIGSRPQLLRDFLRRVPNQPLGIRPIVDRLSERNDLLSLTKKLACIVTVCLRIVSQVDDGECARYLIVVVAKRLVF